MSVNKENKRRTAIDDTQYWYVMTHLEPSLIDRQLQVENARRFNQGQPTILYVIPFQYMVKAQVGQSAEDRENNSQERKRSAKEVCENNSLRECLHSFVFIKATEGEITALTGSDWNRNGRLHLCHYRTKSGSPIKVSQEEMQPFLIFFIEQRQRFSFMPYGEDVSFSETVYIKRGVFKDCKATVIEVCHTADGISLTLGLPMFGNDVMMKIYDYPVSDVKINARMEHLFEPQFVKAMESDLLDILRRRVLRRTTDESFREDMQKLNSYSILHYLKFENTATHNHFHALMLLCATLRGDKQVKETLIPLIQGMISSTAKPCTDEEAFYLAVLFIATKKVDYRKTVREYCLAHEIKSASLAAIMPLVKKIQVRSK